MGKQPEVDAKALQRKIARLDEEKALFKMRLEKLRKMYIEQVSRNEELEDYIKELEELRQYEKGKL